jgi:hypothetical protein
MCPTKSNCYVRVKGDGPADHFHPDDAPGVQNGGDAVRAGGRLKRKI